MGDRTGSPLGGGAGCSCHGGGSFLPTISSEVKNVNGAVVTQYIPGELYTLELSVSASSGAPSGYAFQAVSLSGNSSMVNAGNMLSANSLNTRISNFNGRQYAEHNELNTSGVFTIN